MQTPQAHASPERLRKLDYDLGKSTWVELPPPPPGTAAGELFAIHEMIKGGRYSRAVSATQAWIKKYGVEDPLHPEALVTRASAFIGKRDYDHAYKVLQEFQNRYAGIAITEEALRLQFIVAEAYLAGNKRKIWGLFPVSGVDRGYEMLDEISTNHAESPLAELAAKAKADHMFRTGEHALSSIEYGRLLREFPQSRYQPFAMRRSADAALAGFGGVEYDEAALIDADERYNDYRIRYPAVADREGVGLVLESIQERRAEKNLSIAQYYERTRHPSSAIYYYQWVVENWPQSIAAGRARSRLAVLGVTPRSPEIPGPPAEGK